MIARVSLVLCFIGQISAEIIYFRGPKVVFAQGIGLEISSPFGDIMAKELFNENMKHAVSTDPIENTVPEISIKPDSGFKITIKSFGVEKLSFYGSLFSKTGLLLEHIFLPNQSPTQDKEVLIEKSNRKIEGGEQLHYILTSKFMQNTFIFSPKIFEFNGESGTFLETEKCENTISSSNGWKFCPNQLIFQEDFKDDSYLKRWTVERKFPQEPDYEFVLYSNEAIEKTSTGIKITPKLFTDAYLGGLRQNFDVQNCTGVPNSKSCKYTAVSSQDIIAPFVSAQISTKNSFSFKYGRIEIRAKLPRGDWIVPQLLIVPKNNTSGKDLIRIIGFENNPTKSATTIRQILMNAGVPGEERSGSITQELKYFEDNWDNEFHEFGLEIRPGDAKFFTGDESGSIEDPMTDYEREIMKKEPYEQEFYIVLGVGVGGITDFDEGTPWKSYSSKRKEQFYNDMENWKKSWMSGRDTLEVDYIKVYSF